MKTQRKFKKSNPTVSIVIPIYNEEENLKILIERLTKVLKEFTSSYEVIFVNDGSTDNSLSILRSAGKQDKHICAIDLSRNFGHQTALAAGLAYARGSAIVMMDGDLQDPPELIPQLLERWREGYEVVYAIRAERKENVLKKMAYQIFYRILHALSDITIPLDSGDFGLIDRKVVDLINHMPERTRFLRGLRSWVGFRQIGLAYNRDARFSGKPKYSFSKLLKLAFDGVISFSTAPLRFATAIGFFISFISFILILFYVYLFFTTPRVPGFTTLIIILLFIGGIQLITVGILGEYIGRIYDETKQRPLFIARETINIPE
jgi:dolichol-phosphate mannosyltransferase